jgi:hypothetical protein
MMWKAMKTNRRYGAAKYLAAAALALLAGCGGGGSPILGIPSDPQVGGPAVVVAPTVVEVFPANQASQVCSNALLTAKFNQAMDPATVNNDTFGVRVRVGQIGQILVPVEGAVTYDEATNTATFTPGALLADDSSFTATIVSGDSGVKNLAGVSLASDFVWSFTTRLVTCEPD